MNLKSKTEKVISRDDFVNFVIALSEDFRVNPKEWQNRTLDAFLESLSAWVQDMDGYYENNHMPIPTTPDWKNLAEMLLAAKYYE